MSKLKIEHGASKMSLVLLKTNIEDSISQDIDLIAAWSENERKYIVNELLRFALTQEEEFLKYKAGLATGSERSVTSPKQIPSAMKPVIDAVVKSDPSSTARG